MAESAILILVCTKGARIETNKIPIAFKSSADPFASATGDPHFRQPIIDETTWLVNYVCYDVSGKTGEYLYIAGFKRNNLKVFAQLKDDYYMHKIIIQSPFGNVTITKELIILDNKQIYNWEIGQANFQTKFFYYFNKKNKVVLEMRTNSLKKFPLTILIEKGENLMNEVYFNVGFNFPLSWNEWSFWWNWK